jgi:arabinogalactan endo-1,4-beta-galactosidase
MYLGGDLSYVNELEAKGAIYYENGSQKDPFTIWHEHGANLVRVRLWHTPTWTDYCNLADVERTIRRAKAQGMTVMLDIHYSDTWADPAKQIIPAAWAHLTDLSLLETAVREYTVDVLQQLNEKGLMPDFVQVGNEINTEMLMPGPYANAPINWVRNARLIKAGVSGVREAGSRAGKQPSVLLHIAQPENILTWFDEALAASVQDFDVIGMSYYPKWSTHSVTEAGAVMRSARERYGKRVMVVETAYPFTLDTGMVAAESHLLAQDAVTPNYPATPAGQLTFLNDLTDTTQRNGGLGVVYWEPMWISTPQFASIWENAALFDYRGEVQQGIGFLRRTSPAQAQE